MTVDADIQVINNKLTTITGSIERMHGQLSAKIEQVASLQLQMVRLQEQQQSMYQAQERIFASQDKHRTRIEAAETSIAKMLSFMRGTVLVGAVLFSFATWYATGKLNSVDEALQSITMMDRRLMLIEQYRYPNLEDGP